MRVIHDPKTTWKAERACPQCKAVLEIEAADIFYVELGSGLDNQSDWYYVVRCPICQKRIELDRATLPEWIQRERKEAREPLTASTITDEQIRELMMQSASSQVIADCKLALQNLCIGYAPKHERSAAECEQRAARARCAELLNARAQGSKDR